MSEFTQPTAEEIIKTINAVRENPNRKIIDGELGKFSDIRYLIQIFLDNNVIGSWWGLNDDMKEALIDLINPSDETRSLLRTIRITELLDTETKSTVVSALQELEN